MQEQIEKLESDINQKDKELLSARNEVERERSLKRSEVERVTRELVCSQEKESALGKRNSELEMKNRELETKNRELETRNSELRRQSSTDVGTGEQLQKANFQIEGLQEELHSLRNPRGIGMVSKRIEVRLNESIGRVKELEHQLSCVEGLKEVRVGM